MNTLKSLNYKHYLIDMIKINYEEYQTPNEFMKFKEGKNLVRIVSGGGITRKHAIKAAGRFIPLGECIGEGCQHCTKNSPKTSYIWIVIDRATKQLKVMEVGKVLGDMIAKLGKANGDPQQYDIEITRKGLTKETTKYEVQELPASALNEDDIKIVKANKQYLINKYFV